MITSLYVHVLVHCCSTRPMITSLSLHALVVQEQWQFTKPTVCTCGTRAMVTLQSLHVLVVHVQEH